MNTATPAAQPIERLWEEYRDLGLPKMGPMSEWEVKRHRETFFTGAAAMLALFSAPLRVPELKENPHVLTQWIEDIFAEVKEHNSPTRSWSPHEKH